MPRVCLQARRTRVPAALTGLRPSRLRPNRDRVITREPVQLTMDGGISVPAFAEAQKTKRPVAVLVGDEYHGFNR